MNNNSKYSALDKSTLAALDRLKGKLMTPVLILEIQRAYEYLGYLFTEEQRRKLMAMKPEELTAETQIILSAVALRGQTETGEHIRSSLDAQRSKDGPKNDPLS